MEPNRNAPQLKMILSKGGGGGGGRAGPRWEGSGEEVPARPGCQLAAGRPGWPMACWLAGLASELIGRPSWPVGWPAGELPVCFYVFLLPRVAAWLVGGITGGPMGDGRPRTNWQV